MLSCLMSSQVVRKFELIIALITQIRFITIVLKFVSFKMLSHCGRKVALVTRIWFFTTMH